MLWLDTVNAGIDQQPWVITMIDSTASRYRVPIDGPAWVGGVTEPSGAFKWVWDNVFSVKQRLGDPTDTWYSSDGALQRFDSGTMIWLGTPPDGGKPMIYVVQSDLMSTSTGSFQAYPDQSAQ